MSDSELSAAVEAARSGGTEWLERNSAQVVLALHKKLTALQDGVRAYVHTVKEIDRLAGTSPDDRVMELLRRREKDTLELLKRTVHDT